jgi:hypothetical protein
VEVVEAVEAVEAVAVEAVARLMFCGKATQKSVW